MDTATTLSRHTISHFEQNPTSVTALGCSSPTLEGEDYIRNLSPEMFMTVRAQIRRSYINICSIIELSGLQIHKDLVAAMTTSERPEDRPHIEDVNGRFAVIGKSLSKTELRSALTLPRIIRAAQVARQYVRTIQYILSQRAVIPDP
jgi:hypothetical protein